MKQTAVTFLDHKQKGEKISMLTAYDYSTAKLVDQAGIDGILVGDSLGNVMLGYEDTLSVTVEDMIHHGAAVARGVKNALVVIDMPFLSYQTSVYDAVKNAGRLVKEGHAGAVKLEGGKEFAPQIRAITAASIPVMGHLGLTPQSIHTLGGYRVQGKTEAAAQKLLEDALAVQEAGAFALTLECVPAKLAQLITQKLSIPTIGIGAGAPPEVPEGTVKRCLPGRVIMPGIVNIHTHVGGTLFKGLAEDIKGAFYGLAFPMERFITRESMYSISMLGAMEAVKFGSTFIDDLYHFPESTARAAEELGLRGIIAQKIYDPDLQNLHNNDYSSVPGQAAQKLQAKPLSLWRSRCSPSSWSISAASNPLPGPTFCRAFSWSSSSRRSRPSAGVLPM